MLFQVWWKIEEGACEQRNTIFPYLLDMAVAVKWQELGWDDFKPNFGLSMLLSLTPIHNPTMFRDHSSKMEGAIT